MLSTHSNINLKRIKRQILSHVKLVRAFILLIIAIPILLVGSLGLKALKNSVIGKSIQVAGDFVFPNTNKILTNKNRVNFLILGTAGPGRGNQDEDITDTIIFSSVGINTKKISLISIPRDIWIPDLKDKINSAYMYGKQKGVGMILAKSTVEKIVGQEIDYAIVIDFSGFKDIVDTIGGIEVNVQNDFVDRQYPIAGRENDTCNGDKTYSCRYETISFQKGNQHMDGETALKFVRSRHAEGVESGDIARESRQQLVIDSIVKKILTPSVFLNINTDLKLLKIMRDKIKTDMSPEELSTLLRFLFNARSNITSHTIPESFLYNPPNQYLYHNEFYDHAFVFIPSAKDGKWTAVQEWLNDLLP